jgi:cell division protein FtsI/penicillin-binding protein 2
VERKEYPDGTVEDIAPTFLHQVITPETAEKIAGMLVAVVEYGHGKRAGVPGYYIAGKTGTAQIAENGVYSATAFNGSFAGFGPVEDPRFAMVVKIENPKSGVIYAESTAAPLFGEIADFLLTYYNVPPTRAMKAE